MASLRVTTAGGPIDAAVAVPGSKSIANRALVCAALADGRSELAGLPDGDDTAAMLRALGDLGVPVSAKGSTAVIEGTGGRMTARGARVDAGLAGTTSRFVTALAALAPGPVTVDGAAPLRRRPMGPLHDALRALGAGVETPGGPGRLPVTVTGPLVRGATLRLPGDVSSQFLTALMLIGPRLDGGLRIDLTSPLVSAPYVRLTATVMAAFGVGGVEVAADRIVVAPERYVATAYVVEPDASSASYPLAMAAVAGGRVTIPGLTASSAQGDIAIVDLLAGMGCRRADGDALGVERDRAAALRGTHADMAAVSDLVPTVAAVAVTAMTATTISGVGFIRDKESDRLGDLAGELRKVGAVVDVRPAGLHIEPVAALHGARLATHHDHRLAMAFAVLGTVVDGIELDDASVVTKSWPGFWATRDMIVGGT